MLDPSMKLQSIRTPGYRRRIKLIDTFELDGDLGLIQKFTKTEVPKYLYNFTTLDTLF